MGGELDRRDDSPSADMFPGSDIDNESEVKPSRPVNDSAEVEKTVLVASWNGRELKMEMPRGRGGRSPTGVDMGPTRRLETQQVHGLNVRCMTESPTGHWPLDDQRWSECLTSAIGPVRNGHEARPDSSAHPLAHSALWSSAPRYRGAAVARRFSASPWAPGLGTCVRVHFAVDASAVLRTHMMPPNIPSGVWGCCGSSFAGLAETRGTGGGPNATPAPPPHHQPGNRRDAQCRHWNSTITKRQTRLSGSTLRLSPSACVRRHPPVPPTT